MLLPKKEIELDERDKRYLSEFNLEPVKTIEDMAGWNGFIDTEGNFYVTKPIGATWWNGSANLHSDWADAFMLQYGYENYELPREVNIDGKPEHIYGGKDWLVHGEGWLSCTFDSECVGICIQYRGYDTRNISKAQMNTLFDIFRINNLPMKEYNEIIEDSKI